MAGPRPGERDLDVCAVRCRRSSSVPSSTSLPAAQDPDPIAERLDLGEDVRREEHGLAAVRPASTQARGTPAPSADRARSSARRGAAGRRASPARRSAHLLPVALRERPDLLARRPARTARSARRGRRVGPPWSEQDSSVSSPVSGPQDGSPGTYATRRCAATDRARRRSRRSRRGPAGRAMEPEQQPDRRRLAGAVRPEEP